MGGVAALVTAAMLLAGIGGFAARFRRLRPWLAVLFGINAGWGDVSRDTLRGINPIDVLLLLLAGVTFIGFWPGPGTRQLAWTALAIALPFAGIVILLATGLAGRSGLMGGTLVLSILMLLDDGWTGAGYMGIAASALLLVGDVGTSGRRSRLMATIVATGYVALSGWFLWIAARLL